jgi:hypothetical protein
MPGGRNDHYYRVLGVDPSASAEELKRAHRDLAQVWHPDRFTANPRLRKVAEQKLLEINQAYDALRSARRTSPPVEAVPPAPVQPPAKTMAPALRQRLRLGVQAAGVAAAILLLILAGRGVHALLTVKPSPPPVAAVAVPQQEEPQSSPPASRRVHAGPVDQRITNGEEIVEPRGRAGVGRLSVNNQTEEDAVATLLDQSTGATLRMVYVTAGMQTLIDGIGPGVYRLSLSSGSGWNGAARAFMRDRTAARSVGPFSFTQVQTAGQVRGDQYSIVLRGEATVSSDISQAGG